MERESKIDTIDTYSEQVREVLDKVPNWLVRWGSASLLCIVIIAIVFSSLAKYPDVVNGRLALTTKEPVVKIVIPNSGKLTQLYLADESIVSAGASIAEVSNPTSQNAIPYLNQFLADAQRLLRGSASLSLIPDSGLIFGGLQTTYSELKKACIDYQNLTSDDYNKEQSSKLSGKKSDYTNLIRITQNQITIATNEVQNANEKLAANKKLYSDKVISKLEFFSEESGFHQKQQELENLKKTLNQYSIELREIERQMLEAQHGNFEQARAFKDLIATKIQELQNGIESWKQSYSITAPSNGRLVYLKKIYRNQFIKPQESLFAIIPENSTYLAIVSIPGQGFGKVQVGQRVKIKFDNFPYLEYGQVEGIIITIAQIPEENVYRAEVELPKGLVSSYNKHLKYRPEMSGTAEIITKNLTLIDRIFPLLAN